MANGLRGGGSVKAIAHDQIKNFVPCKETTGTDVTAEHGAVIADAALEFVTNGVKFVTDTTSTVTLDTGSWQTLHAGDYIAMFLFKQSGTMNFSIGSLGTGATLQNFHYGGGDSPANRSGAAVGNIGQGGTTEWITPTVPNDALTRLVWKCNYGTNFEVSQTGSGEEVDFSVATTIPTGSETWDDIGDVANFSDKYAMIVPGAAYMELYGIQMVEFKNGFPVDLDARINKTLDLWEAGNKAHFPVYVGE